MVKLVSARDFRAYGPRRSRSRAEYINAGLYLFATVVLLGGFVAQLSREAKSGLALILLASTLIAIVNFHDLFAHLAGIDYRLPLLVQYDPQLALVEFAVPIVQAIGALLFLLAALFLLIQVPIHRFLFPSSDYDSIPTGMISLKPSILDFGFISRSNRYFGVTIWAFGLVLLKFAVVQFVL